MLSAAKIIESISGKNFPEKFKVKSIGLFGSFAEGAAKANSDIDFVVEFFEPTFDNYMGLKLALEGKFKRKVDLVTPRALRPELRHVLRSAVYAKAD